MGEAHSVSRGSRTQEPSWEAVSVYGTHLIVNHIIYFFNVVAKTDRQTDWETWDLAAVLLAL